MARLCLNMIVKNEGARIERALNSVTGFITGAVIVDTGSTDDTKEKIRAYFEERHLPLVLEDAPFENWSQARNAALAHTRHAWCQHTIEFDYLLLMDADMELRVTDTTCFDDLTGKSYDMMQHAGLVHYLNRRLLKADQPGQYLGVTHEYLNVDSSGAIPEAKAFFFDHSDGANRPEKFKRDIKLLKQGLRDEPTNARYMFYLAQSYRDGGKPAPAAEWYKKRVRAGGWDEEVWQAQMNYATCLKSMGDEAGFIREMLVAYNMRPSRAETLYDLARHYRDKGMNAPAAMIAETAMSIPYSKDALFVNDFVYRVGCAEEFSISAWYMPDKRARGFDVTNRLALLRTPYGNVVECARQNMYHYLPKLVEVCPSFVSKQIEFSPQEGWTPMNPSVTLWKNRLYAVIRTVNYRMDEQGCYLIGDAPPSNENPITTRNWLAWIGDDLVTIDTSFIADAVIPKEFPAVVGFEDMRLFGYRGELHTSSTVRQIHPDGNCEQVRAVIKPLYQSDTFEMRKRRLAEPIRMLREPRQTQKNWAPIVEGDTLRFMYRLGEVVDDQGNTIAKYDTGHATDHISGGSQLIEFYGGWLSLVHEARCLPNSHLRYYWHRFAFFDKEFRLKHLSRPFVFNDKLIEFAAGLCWHPDGKRLVISYGCRDAEAWIGTVDASNVRMVL